MAIRQIGILKVYFFNAAVMQSNLKKQEDI